LFDTQIDSTNWEELEPQPPFYLFIPQDTSRLNEYNEFWKISDVMNQNGDPAPGIVTTHDQFAISWSEQESKDKVFRFLETTSEDEARGLFRLCSQAQWNYDRAKRELSTVSWIKNIKPILYRPFDVRWTIFDANVAVHRRKRVMRHMLAGANIGFCTDREVNGDFRHVLCTRQLIDDCTVSLQTKERTYIFPLYLYPAEGEMQFEGGRRPNLNPEFIKAVSDKLGLKFIDDGRGDFEQTFGPEDIFNYAYAVFHSPTYRSRYAEFLKIDFPRLPITSDKE
ncbi:unnamed protein product, partial [marine sediment metagenome]